MRRIHLVTAVLVFGLDRLTKWLVAREIALYKSIQIIPGCFRLTHVENRGAAFSLFADSSSPWRMWLLVGFSVVALIIVFALLWRDGHTRRATGIGLSLILGGAFGNLWDRVATGRVVDFLLVYLGQYQWPAFNVADSAIVIGAALLAIEILFSSNADKAAT